MIEIEGEIEMKSMKYLQIAILLTVMTTFGCESFLNKYISAEPWKTAERARAAVMNQQYDLAEQLYLKNSEINKKNGSKGVMSDYIELAKIYRAQGRYPDAVAISKRYHQLYNEGRPADEKIPVDVDTESFMAQGKFEDVLKALISSAKRIKLQKQRNPNHVGPGVLLPFFSNYYMQTGNYELARKYLQARVIECEHRPADKQDLAEAKNNLAFAYYYAGDNATAERLFREASGLSASATVPFGEDLAKSLTMLGKIAEHQGQNDQALKFFQSARSALHEDRTMVYKVEESDILGQIGRFHLHQGNLTESSAAYHEAIALRRATATTTHPNCADAIKGLADVAAAKGELTSATLQATEALKILDASVVPTHPRIAPELVALASIHILAGQPEQAAPLFTRLETILQKPLGPWKEDFMDTMAFYAGLLKKAGKTAEAERLAQLQAHQKDRR